VTVYVPDALTVGVAVVPPETMPGPAQLKLTLGLPEVAERTTEVVVHVSVPPVALAPGGVHGSPTAKSLKLEKLLYSVDVPVLVYVPPVGVFQVPPLKRRNSKLLVIAPPGTSPERNSTFSL